MGRLANKVAVVTGASKGIGERIGSEKDPDQFDQSGDRRKPRVWSPPASSEATYMETGIVSQTPLGRSGRPGDIAPLAVFLASAESGWVTGESLVASGGVR